uniref:Chromo domain-containing protein n=1 Tax=Kalanchoe fedtschenkoi TaxID=63787 RepID=A0A7N0UDN3_KALFE
MGSKSHSRDESSDEGDNSSGGDAPPSNSAVFSEGERVLAYHGPRIYEAKVQKTEFRKKEWKYFVHYLGWNKSWDEWVGADRLLKHTEENVLKQQALEKKQGVDKNTKSGRGGHTKPKSSAEAKADKEDNKTHVSRGKKRKSDSAVEKDNASVEKPVKIQMPSSLRKQLVEDWESVTQQNKLVKLPRSPTVDEILTKYLEYKSKKDPQSADAVGEILKGVRCYFDKALALMLLYKKERSQFNEAIAENVSPSTVYGAEHLLRLFVKLPELLSFLNIDQETSMRLQQRLLDFLKFLQKHQSTFFLSAYETSKSSQGSGKAKEI